MSLIDKKNAAVAQLNQIADKAKAESRSFNDEERKQFDTLETEVRSYGEDILREQRASKFKSEVETVLESRVLPAIGNSKDKLEAFRSFVMQGGEYRDFTVGGGVLVPNTIDAGIRAVVAALPGIENAAGAKILNGFASYPAFASATAAWVTEGNPISANILGTSSIDLKPFALASLGTFTDRLANASGEEFVADFVTTYADALYRKSEEAFWTGSGVDQPLGLAVGAGMDGALTTKNFSLSSGSIANASLNTIVYTVPAEHRAQSVWIASDTFLAAVAGMVDTTGRNLGLLTVANGVPYILGYKVISFPVAVGSAAGTPIAMFGNLNQYRIARFGNGAYFYKRLNELYAASLSSGHLLSTYKDGRIGRKAGFVKVLAVA